MFPSLCLWWQRHTAQLRNVQTGWKTELWKLLLCFMTMWILLGWSNNKLGLIWISGLLHSTTKRLTPMSLTICCRGFTVSQFHIPEQKKAFGAACGRLFTSDWKDDARHFFCIGAPCCLNIRMSNRRRLSGSFHSLLKVIIKHDKTIQSNYILISSYARLYAC